MNRYWGAMDKHGHIELSPLPEAQTRQAVAKLAEAHPECAPFRVVCLAVLTDVADDLESMIRALPEGITAPAAIRAVAIAFAAIGLGDEGIAEVQAAVDRRREATS